MKTTLYTSILLVLMLAHSAFAQSVLCLGDSITYGQIMGGGRLTAPYPTVLQGLSGISTTNAGAPGETTAQMRSRWDAGLRSGGYSHLVLLGGVNDVGLDVPLSTTESNLEYLWNDAKSRGMTVIAVTVTPWKNETYGYWTTTRQANTEALNTWIRTRAVALGVIVVDAYPVFGGQGGDPDTLLTAYDSGDHIHPNQAGANLLASKVAPAILRFTITPYSGNPIITPSGTGNDSLSTTDPWVGKSGNGTYYVIYSGVTSGYLKYSLMVASAPSMTGPWTRLGTLLEYSGLPSDIKGVDGGVYGIGDPFALYDGTKWHLWHSAIPTEVTTNWQTVGARGVAHYTNTASGDTFPMTGWVVENSRAVMPLTTGWTSDGSGHPSGVASPKVYPKDGGGWVMFLANWMHSADSVGGKSSGYATASSLNGPWTISAQPIVGSLNAQAPWTGQYQAEQLSYFKSGSKHYMLCNRSSLTTQAVLIGQNAYNISTDLWVSDNQLGPYTIAQLDAFPTQPAWFTERGVVSIVNDSTLNAPNTDSHALEGIFQGRFIGTASFKIGTLTISGTTPITTTAAASTATTRASFR